jgi:hypothetical protein
MTKAFGLVNSQTIGRAGVHTINEGHVSVTPLRVLLDPITTLTDRVREAVGHGVTPSSPFGSIARGEANMHSDVDLAVMDLTDIVLPQRHCWHCRSQVVDVASVSGSSTTTYGSDCRCARRPEYSSKVQQRCNRPV